MTREQNRAVIVLIVLLLAYGLAAQATRPLLLDDPIAKWSAEIIGDMPFTPTSYNIETKLKRPGSEEAPTVMEFIRAFDAAAGDTPANGDWTLTGGFGAFRQYKFDYRVGPFVYYAIEDGDGTLTFMF